MDASQGSGPNRKRQAKSTSNAGTSSSRKPEAGSGIGFISDMAHELRTPLNTIIGFSGTLLMGLPGPLNAEQEKQIGLIKSTAHRLLTLINDVVDLAKIDSGKIELGAEHVPVAKIVDDVVRSVASIVQSKGLTIEISDMSPGLLAIADLSALRRILDELVTNAIKFTDTGGVRIEISRLETPHGGQAAISISDTGIGIAESDQATVFQPFVQFAKPAGNDPQGSGIGLHVSQRLARLMAGEITFRSLHTVGSTFTVTLPAE